MFIKPKDYILRAMSHFLNYIENDLLTLEVYYIHKT